MTRALEVAVRRRVGGFTLDVAFDAPGGITALVGPSGAGKTLTLRAVAGLVRPDAGRVACGGRVLFERAAGAAAAVDVPARARRVGVVFQQPALFPHLSAAANVAYGLPSARWPHGWFDRAARARRAARVEALLALVELPGLSARRPHELSGGQQQRVALARALAAEPALLLLDEPFAAADAPLRGRLGATVRGVHEETGVPMVLVTHDEGEAERLADRVVRVRDGAARGAVKGRGYDGRGY